MSDPPLHSSHAHTHTHPPHPDTVKSILRRFLGRPAAEKQAFVDAANEFGNTGLHWAALGGHLAVVRCLVEEHGAGVGLANDRNYVPLDLASFGDEPKRDVVDYFLSTMDKLEQEGGEGEKEKEGAGGGGLAAAAEGLAVGDDEVEDEEVVSMSAKAGDGDVKA
jgi:hypothetical protein